MVAPFWIATNVFCFYLEPLNLQYLGETDIFPLTTCNND